jgi:hypothetical protein
MPRGIRRWMEQKLSRQDAAKAGTTATGPKPSANTLAQNTNATRRKVEAEALKNHRIGRWVNELKRYNREDAAQARAMAYSWDVRTLAQHYHKNNRRDAPPPYQEFESSPNTQQPAASITSPPHHQQQQFEDSIPVVLTKVEVNTVRKIVDSVMSRTQTAIDEVIIDTSASAAVAVIIRRACDLSAVVVSKSFHLTPDQVHACRPERKHVEQRIAEEIVATALAAPCRDTGAHLIAVTSAANTITAVAYRAASGQVAGTPCWMAGKLACAAHGAAARISGQVAVGLTPSGQVDGLP